MLLRFVAVATCVAVTLAVFVLYAAYSQPPPPSPDATDVRPGH
jgi:hypothetical protein